MKYFEKVKLKDNRDCILRTPENSDAENVLALFVKMLGQSDNLALYPEENTFSLGDEKDFLAEKSNSLNSIYLCAFVDDVLVGGADFWPLSSTIKTRHRANFGISVDKSYHNLGIGKALTKACIKCAKEAGYLQLELQVITSNTSAIALYKDLGFVEFGRNPKGFLTKTKEWQELIYMRLEL